MNKVLSSIGAILSATIVAFCWQISLILASLGLGSATLGKWLPDHKGLFLVTAVILMSLSLFFAVREKKKNGKNAGLVIFSVAFIITLSLLTYTKMQYG